MNKLFSIIVFTILLAFASNGVCDTPGMVRLLEERDFWASCQWDKFDESPLYRSTTWKLVGMSARGDVKISDTYSTQVFINNLPVQELNMNVAADSKDVTSFEAYSLNRVSTEDHQTFLNWCTARFGTPEKEEEKRSENLGFATRNTISSRWVIGNTLITIRTVNNLSNGPSSVGFITTLSFKRYYPPPTVPPATNTVTNSTTPAMPHIPDGEPRQAITRSQPAIGITPAVRQTAATAARGVPAMRHARPDAIASGLAKATNVKRYQPPPYIWDSESGATTVANDISDVPEETRAQFELKP